MELQNRRHTLMAQEGLSLEEPDTLMMSTVHGEEPVSVEEAFQDERWVQAMNSEYQALIKNKTWHLVPPPARKNIIGCKWVFKIKQKADGSIDRYKGRLVAKGYK
jgi:hypothetical protein